MLYKSFSTADPESPQKLVIMINDPSVTSSPPRRSASWHAFRGSPFDDDAPDEMDDKPVGGINKLTIYIVSCITLVSLFGNYLFAFIFGDIFASLADGIDFGHFHKAWGAIAFPQALFEKLRLSEQEDAFMRMKLATALDIIVVRAVVEIATNIVTGFITFRYGHTCPIVFGCFSGLVAAFCLIFASRARWILIMTTVIHAMSSGVLTVGGLSLLVKFFDSPSSRQRATTSLHILSTIAYVLAPLSTVGMAVWGPWTVLAFVATLLFSAVLLFNLFFPIGQPYCGKLITERTYLLRVLLNHRVIVTLICSFVVGFSQSILMAKSTSFLREIPDVEQNNSEIATVVYGGFAVQLFFQLLFGIVCVPLVAKPGITLIVSIFLAGVVFMTYPKTLSETFWLIVTVQFVGRACLGVAAIVILPVLIKLVSNRILRRDGPDAIVNNHGIIVAIYVAVYQLSSTLGPICFHLLRNVRSVSVAYTAIGILLIVVSPLALFIVGRCLCKGNPRRFSFATRDETPLPNDEDQETVETSGERQSLLKKKSSSWTQI